MLRVKQSRTGAAGANSEAVRPPGLCFRGSKDVSPGSWGMGAREEQWEGTASELLTALVKHVKQPETPKAPHKLTGRLRLAGDALRKAGVEMLGHRGMAKERSSLSPVHPGTKSLEGRDLKSQASQGDDGAATWRRKKWDALQYG